MGPIFETELQFLLLGHFPGLHCRPWPDHWSNAFLQTRATRSTLLGSIVHWNPNFPCIVKCSEKVKGGKCYPLKQDGMMCIKSDSLCKELSPNSDCYCCSKELP